MVDEFYPLPETRECILKLAGCELFGTVDLTAMYWQCELHPDSRRFTGFATEDGVFQFRRVPFGLKCAVAHAQREFRKILRSDRRLDDVNNYIDDCFFGTGGPDKYNQFLATVTALFEVCHKFNVKLSPEKTKLGLDSITVLGHVVDARGVRIDPARKAALCDLPTPSGSAKDKLKQLASALGAMQYVRPFIPNFSVVAAPLTGMKVWTWGREQEHAFRRIKTLIAEADILSNPDYSKEFFLVADASKKGCGACLFQWHVDSFGARSRRVIAFVSRKFCPRESNWKVIEQECASVIFALTKLRPLIQGCPVTVLNDHRNLRWLQSSDSPKLVRWSMVLDE